MSAPAAPLAQQGGTMALDIDGQKFNVNWGGSKPPTQADADDIANTIRKQQGFAMPTNNPKDSGNWRRLYNFAVVNGFQPSKSKSGLNNGFDATGLGHNKGSWHYSGDAQDISVTGKSDEDIQGFIQAAQQAGYHVLPELTRPTGRAWSGPHLHLSYREGTSIPLAVTGLPLPGNMPIGQPDVGDTQPEPSQVSPALAAMIPGGLPAAIALQAANLARNAKPAKANPKQYSRPAGPKNTSPLAGTGIQGTELEKYFGTPQKPVLAAGSKNADIVQGDADLYAREAAKLSNSELASRYFGHIGGKFEPGQSKDLIGQTMTRMNRDDEFQALSHELQKRANSVVGSAGATVGTMGASSLLPKAQQNQINQQAGSLLTWPVDWAAGGQRVTDPRKAYQHPGVTEPGGLLDQLQTIAPFMTGVPGGGALGAIAETAAKPVLGAAGEGAQAVSQALKLAKGKAAMKGAMKRGVNPQTIEELFSPKAAALDHNPKQYTVPPGPQPPEFVPQTPTESYAVTEPKTLPSHLLPEGTYGNPTVRNLETPESFLQHQATEAKAQALKDIPEIQAVKENGIHAPTGADPYNYVELDTATKKKLQGLQTKARLLAAMNPEDPKTIPDFFKAETENRYSQIEQNLTSAKHPVSEPVTPPESVAPTTEAKPASKPKAPQIATSTAETPTQNVSQETITGTGLARQFEDPERTALGKQPTPTGGISVKQLADDGQHLLNAHGPQHIEGILNEGRALEPHEVAEAAAYKRTIKNRENDILNQMEGGVDHVTQTRLNNELDRLASWREKISNAAQLTRTKFHQLGQGLQVAYEPDFSKAELVRKAKAMNGGGIDANTQAKMETLAKENAKLSAALDKERSRIAAKIRTAKTPNLTPPEQLEARRQALVKKIQQRTGFAEGNPDAKGFGSKKTGAMLMPGPTGSDLSDMNKLMGVYQAQGTNTLDGMLGRLRTDMPHLSDEHFLDMMSGEYRHLRTLRTQAQNDAMQELRNVRRAATFRNQSLTAKIAQTSFGLMQGMTRNMKLIGHASAPFQQGEKMLYIQPGQWLKWGKMVEGYGGGEAFLKRQMAGFQNDPIWDVMRQSGAKLGLTKHGEFLDAEAHLADAISKKIPVYNKAVEHSNAAFAGYLNDMRFNVAKKWIAKNPNDPAYVRDVVRLVNVLTGRGGSTGTLSKIAGTEGAGAVLFSPRYTLSKWEYASGHPIWAAESKAGRNLAITQGYIKPIALKAALVGTLLMTMKGLGAKVDLDPRSSTFGALELGPVRINPFKNEAEPVKIVTQLIFGSMNKSGFHKPNFRDTLGQYAEGKLTPLARLGVEKVQGAYNDKGKKVPLTAGKAASELFEPITEQSTREEWQKGAGPFSLANIVGLETRAGKINRPSHKLY